MDLHKEWDAVTPKLFGYLVNILHDKALAEDILQTTWLKAIEALPRFTARGAGFRAWLFAIARNECKQCWRKTNREIVFDTQEHDIAVGSSAEASILAEQILTKLPEDDRELLRLRYIADLSMSEIAAILNINFIAVRVRVHRALKRAQAYV